MRFCTWMKKNGGNDRDANWINDFRKVIRECKLRDLGCISHPFTWFNKRFGPYFIEEMLDRFLRNDDWTQTFQDHATKNLITWCSNHNPVVMEVIGRNKGAGYNKKTMLRFHYEDMWSPYKECKEIVKQEWAQKGAWVGSNPIQIFKKVNRDTLAELRCWSRETFKGSKEKLEKLMNIIKELQEHGRQHECREELKS